MKTHAFLSDNIRRLSSSLELPNESIGAVDTRHCLLELASNQNWSVCDYESIDFFCKRIDISKKLFLGYHANGRKALDEELSDKCWLELLVTVLCKAVLLDAENGADALRLKRFNALFKAIDLHQPEWLNAAAEIRLLLDDAFHSLLGRLPRQVKDFNIGPLSKIGHHDTIPLRTIPITVMFYEGPIARAYLAALKSLGLKPEKIINLVAAKDVATKSDVGRWLPGGFRVSYAASIQRSKIHHWPQHLIKKQPELVNSLLRQVEQHWGISKAVVDDANALLPLSHYSDDVDAILIESLKDKKLLDYLATEPETAVLFTGGGILPPAILELPQLQFLHVHPGFLPDIRGADCALWSLLTTGHFSATCFYMSPGIDTGNIILPCWLPRLIVDGVNETDIDTNYRAIYSFIDPWIRAVVLREFIQNANDKFMDADSIVQSEADGSTYHFMHKRMKKSSLEYFFNQGMNK